jgi:aminomethyltransferase
MLASYYQAARTTAAVVEQDWIGVLQVKGPDRTTWLQAMVSNDVEKLTPGAGCYAGHLNAQGKLVAQMVILAAADSIVLLTERAAIPKLLASFDKLIIMEDVQVSDVSEEFQVIGLLGPRALSIAESWLHDPLGLDVPYQHRVIQDYRLIQGDLGYDVIVPRKVSDKVLRELSDAGATPIDHGTWDVVRTEAGLPVYGVDIDDTTTLPELGEKGINYDKGCYLGQEVVARIKYIGHVNRKFVGLICEGDTVPEIRSAVHSSGKDVGYVTTSLISPTLNKPIALGFVNRSVSAIGTAVELVHGDRKIMATVTGRPIVVVGPA